MGPIRHPLRTDIQAIRALAVVLVVCYHADVVFRGGFIGVDIFFVVSGYVITRSLLAEREATGRIDLVRFYLRRIQRLLPALALMLVAVLIFSLLLLPRAAHSVTALTGTSAAVFNANTYLGLRGDIDGYFGVVADVNPLLHTWSLSVEEQFYLLFPALLLIPSGVGRMNGRAPRVSFPALLGSVSVASLILSWALLGAGTNLAFYLAPARAWEFLVGALLASGVPRAPGGQRQANVLRVLGLFLMLISAIVLDRHTTLIFVPVVGTALLILSGDSPMGRWQSSMVDLRMVQFLGDISYSWYLWHWPIIVFARAAFPTLYWVGPMAAVASFVPAWIAKRLIEDPIRYRESMPRLRTIRVAAVCIVAPVLAAIPLVAGFPGLPSDPLQELPLHADLTLECSELPVARPATTHSCFTAVPNPIGTAVLIGDSNAGHFTEGFQAGALVANYNSLVLTRSVCPYVDIEVLDPDFADREEQCTEFKSQVDQLLTDIRPDVVFVAAAGDLYIESHKFDLASPDKARQYTTPDEKAVAWEPDLRSSLLRVSGRANRVVLILPVPRLPEWNPVDSPPFRLLMDRSVGQDRNVADAIRERTVAAEIAAAGELAELTDFADSLCDPERCIAHRDGSWVFRDHLHISVDASKGLSGKFEQLIANR